jgi:hypothetical protein
VDQQFLASKKLDRQVTVLVRRDSAGFIDPSRLRLANTIAVPELDNGVQFVGISFVGIDVNGRNVQARGVSGQLHPKRVPSSLS